MRSYLNADKNRAFEINGKFVLLKGGGWADDIFLQDTHKTVEAQMYDIRHMNLNSICCEGFWGKDENLYDLCDNMAKMISLGKVILKVKNTSGSIAFFNFLDIIDPQTKLPVLPIFWNDNYVIILPGEERTYDANSSFQTL